MSRPNKVGEEEFLNALYQGGELLAAGKVIEAKDHLEKAYQLQPKNEKGQNLLGLAYFKLGLFDRAAEIYEALVRENPADPTLRVNLGLVYLKTNALPRAIREFETSTDLAPEHKKAQNYLGVALAQAGDYSRAREHFLLAGSDQMAEKMSRALAGGGGPPKGVDVAAGAQVPVAAPPPPPTSAAPTRASPPMMLKRRSTGEEAGGPSATNGATGADLNGSSHSLGVPVKVPLPAPDPPPGPILTPLPATVDDIGRPTESPMSLAMADATEPTTGDIVAVEATSSDDSDQGELIGGEDSSSDPGEMIGDESGSGSSDAVEVIGVEAGMSASDSVEVLGVEPGTDAGGSTEMIGVEAEAAPVEVYQVEATSESWSTTTEAPPAEAPPDDESDWGAVSPRDEREARVQAAIESDAAAANTEEPAASEIALSADDIADGGAISVQRSAAQDDFEVTASSDDVAFEEPQAPPEELPPEPGAQIYDLSGTEAALDPPPELPPEEPITARGEGAVLHEPLDPLPVRRTEAPPTFAEMRPSGASVAKRAKPLEVTRTGAGPETLPVDMSIAELGPRVALFAQSKPGPFQIEAEAVAIMVHGEVLTRILGLVAQSGQLEMDPQNRRFRGRTSDKSFGEGEAQLMRVKGRGRLVVQLPRRTLVSVELGEESGYFLETAVFAFEEALAFENGRVPSDVAPDLDLVHLRGKGRVLLNLPGALRSIAVADGEPVTVPLANLIGWHGNLSPKVTALSKDRTGKALRAGVELSGEGFALLSVTSG